MKRDKIYKLIDEERDYQDRKWGGPEHDRKCTLWNWIVYLTKFVGKFATAVMDGNPHEAKRQLVKVAALCVAALEASFE